MPEDTGEEHVELAHIARLRRLAHLLHAHLEAVASALEGVHSPFRLHRAADALAGVGMRRVAPVR